MEGDTVQNLQGMIPEQENSEFRPSLAPLYTQTLEFVNQQIPEQLLLWLEKHCTVDNLSELPQQVLECSVTTVIKEHQTAIDLAGLEKFDQQIRQKCGESWLPTLEALVKHASLYNESLKIKLDLYRSFSPEKYEELSEELLKKVRLNVNEPLLLENVTKICNKITQIYGEANEWMLQNKLCLENHINEIVEQYDKEIASYQVSSSGKGDLLNHHSPLKEKYQRELKIRFEAIGGSPLTKRILVSYELQLFGLLNKSFDRNARSRKRIAKRAQITADATEIRDERQDRLPAKRQMPIEEDDQADTSTNIKRRMKCSFPDINSILVWMKGEITNVTKVDDTPIRYLKNKIISSGTTATVYHGFYGDDTLGYREVAVKRFRERNIKIFDNEIEAYKQINAISNSSNYNVASLIYCWKWDDYCFLVTELADTDLSKQITRLKKESNRNPVQLLSYVNDITKGLNWLHGRYIIHRDIKPENVLIFNYEHDGNIQEIAKLTDFGISRVVSKEDTGKDTHAAGTDDWASPEVLKAKQKGIIFHNTKSQDIYSLGLTFYYTLTLGTHPFECSDYHGYIKPWNILDKRVSPLQLSDNPIADNIIQRMLNRNPVDRPNIQNILKDPIFWDTTTKLNFITEFATAIGESKTDSAKAIRDSLDKAYLKMHDELPNHTGGFDWLSELDDEKRENLKRRRNQNPSKSYPNDHIGKSISSLVKLIRDKRAHPKDLVDELLKDEHFGSDGKFDERKYAEYFLGTFPNLLLFLIKSLEGFDEFAKLKEKYCL